jgi:5'-3' exonuclease
MILLDFSNIIVSSIMVASRVPDEERFSEDFIRHLVLNSIRSYRKKHYEKYGEMVICTDYLSSWRKGAFPYYKAHRKVQREKQQKEGVDWKALFEIITKITGELEEYFPYKVVQIPHAEGDDVIAVLAKQAKEPCLIVSSDKDFNQLYKYKTVRQFSPMRQKMFSGIDPERYLKEHIIRGDKSDGIPNILSPDNCIVEGERQKPITKKKVEEWMKQDRWPGIYWKRNRELIDFDYIPPLLAHAIEKNYELQKPPNRSGLLNYFVKNKLKMLIEHIGDF